MRHLYATTWEQQESRAACPCSDDVLLIGPCIVVDALLVQERVRCGQHRSQPTLLLMMSAPGRFGGESSLPEAEIALCLAPALVHAAPAIAAPAAWLLTLATQPAASITFKADSGVAGP